MPDSAPPYSLRQYIGDIAKYIRPYRGQFLVGFFFRLTSDLARLYPPWAISQVVAMLAVPANPATGAALLQTFIFWGLSAGYYSWSHNVAKLFGYQVAEKASLDLYRDSLAHIFRLDLLWQEGENSGNKLKRIDRGMDGVNQTIRRVFDVLIEVVVNLVGIVLIFFWLEKTLSFVLVGFMAAYFLIGTALLKRAVKQERVVSHKFEDLGGLTFESLNNIQTIKALAIDQGIMAAVRDQITVLIQEIRRRIRLFQIRGVALLTFEVVFEFTIIAWLAWNIWNGRYGVSLLILFIGLFGKVTESTRELTEVTQQLALAKIWVSRARHILDTEPVIEHPNRIARQQEYPTDWQRLQVRQLHFAYQGGQALQDISFTVQRGEKIGIVGLSGAGKSTLFKLLLDLYENYEGEIVLDEIPLTQIRRQSYIDHTAVVLQDTELFNLSLRENIEIAAVPGQAKPLRLLPEVIKMAHLDEVVAKLPNGLETMIGEKGVKLSGGQRQRLGIARALYRQPDILLLDEATSHLDAHSEKEIQKALEETMANFTTIVIAHRLSTIRAMDKILVLEKGMVAEEGTFDELLRRDGIFARMWREQKL